MSFAARARREACVARHMTQDSPFKIASKTFKSRLIVGTGKYKDFAETRSAVEESGAEIVTVAVRRASCWATIDS